MRCRWRSTGEGKDVKKPGNRSGIMKLAQDRCGEELRNMGGKHMKPLCRQVSTARLDPVSWTDHFQMCESIILCHHDECLYINFVFNQMTAQKIKSQVVLSQRLRRPGGLIKGSVTHSCPGDLQTGY